MSKVILVTGAGRGIGAAMVYVEPEHLPQKEREEEVARRIRGLFEHVES